MSVWNHGAVNGLFPIHTHTVQHQRKQSYREKVCRVLQWNMWPSTRKSGISRQEWKRVIGEYSGRGVTRAFSFFGMRREAYVCRIHLSTFYSQGPSRLVETAFWTRLPRFQSAHARARYAESMRKRIRTLGKTGSYNDPDSWIEPGCFLATPRCIVSCFLKRYGLYEARVTLVGGACRVAKRVYGKLLNARCA